MKKFVPSKYIIGMTLLFFIIPMTLICILVCIIGLNDLTTAICIFLSTIIIIGPVVYYKNQENASIVITNDQITNYINDGTSNFGWTEDLINIKKFEVVNNKEVKKYYRNCKSKKVLLIDFGSYNTKYIAITLFSKKQIKNIINHLYEHRHKQTKQTRDG